MPTESATHRGLTWLWVTFGILSVSAVLIAALTFFVIPLKDRTHGFLSTLILCTASIAYFTMAIDRGYTVAGVDSNPLGVGRSIYYARYVDWFVTTPLLLLEVLLYSGLPLFRTLWLLAADIGMIVLGLFAALETSYQGFRWGYFAFSCFLQLLIINGLFAGYLSAKVRRPKIRFVYLASASYLAILWLGYPIVFGLAEGSNTISVFAEIGAYSILDLLTKVVFGWGLVAGTFYLKGEYEAEYAEGRYLPDSFGAPTYAPLSVTRNPGESPIFDYPVGKQGPGGAGPLGGATYDTRPEHVTTTVRTAPVPHNAPVGRLAPTQGPTIAV